MNLQSRRRRDLAFLVSGLVDGLLGAFLLFVWFDLIPIDLSGMGLSRTAIGIVGALLSLSGVVMVAWQLARIRGPDE